MHAAPDEVRAYQGAQVGGPADHRNLADDRLPPPVSRGDYDHVTARITAAPDADPQRIHFRQATRPGDGVPVVAHLRNRVDLLPRLPVAGTEVPVVEHQHVQPGTCEHLGEGVQVHLLHGGKTVSHHDRRCRPRPSLRRVEPSAQRNALGVKRDVTTSHLAPSKLKTAASPPCGTFP